MTCHLINEAVMKQNCIEAFIIIIFLPQVVKIPGVKNYKS